MANFIKFRVIDGKTYVSRDSEDTYNIYVQTTASIVDRYNKTVKSTDISQYCANLYLDRLKYFLEFSGYTSIIVHDFISQAMIGYGIMNNSIVTLILWSDSEGCINVAKVSQTDANTAYGNFVSMRGVSTGVDTKKTFASTTWLILDKLHIQDNDIFYTSLSDAIAAFTSDEKKANEPVDEPDTEFEPVDDAETDTEFEPVDDSETDFEPVDDTDKNELPKFNSIFENIKKSHYYKMCDEALRKYSKEDIDNVVNKFINEDFDSKVNKLADVVATKMHDGLDMLDTLKCNANKAYTIFQEFSDECKPVKQKIKNAENTIKEAQTELEELKNAYMQKLKDIKWNNKE